MPTTRRSSPRWSSGYACSYSRWAQSQRLRQANMFQSHTCCETQITHVVSRIVTVCRHAELVCGVGLRCSLFSFTWTPLITRGTHCQLLATPLPRVITLMYLSRGKVLDHGVMQDHPGGQSPHKWAAWSVFGIIFGVGVVGAKWINIMSIDMSTGARMINACLPVAQQASSGPPSPFAWVPLSTLGIAVELLGALLQRLGGRLSFAKECLNQGGYHHHLR